MRVTATRMDVGYLPFIMHAILLKRCVMAGVKLFFQNWNSFCNPQILFRVMRTPYAQ